MARNKPRKLKKAASERFRLSGADGNEESGADGNEESGADVNEESGADVNGESGADVNGGKINFNASDASDMRGKEKNNEAYRRHSVISFIICAVFAEVAAVALILLGRTGAERYGSASVPATDGNGSQCRILFKPERLQYFKTFLVRSIKIDSYLLG